MSAALSPCEACARHIRAGEATCPFCGATARAVPAIPPPAMPYGARALIVAASAALALGACDGTVVATAHAESFEPISLAPQYGAPPGYDLPPPPVEPPPPAPAPAVRRDAGTDAARRR